LGTGPPVPLNELGRTLSHNLFFSPVPNLLVNMLLSNSGTQILAKPQLRVMEGQKASVHIGQRIPIATANQYLGATGTTTNYTPITSYTYQDIGVKIEVEPKVHFNREITLKLKAEVSNIADPGKASGLTPAQPTLGTREITTVIRLEDGESSLLAGLIQKNKTKSLTGLPGLSEIPVLGHLFSQNEKTETSSDVVMLVTPHIIRMPNITEQNLEPLYVGTSDKPSLGGSQPSPFASGPAVAPPSSGTPKNTVEAEPGSSSGDQGKSAEGNDTQKPGATPQAGRLLVSPTSIQARVGEPVIVNLVLIGAKELKGMQMSLNFPDGVLKFQGADEGTFFRMGGVNSNFSGQEARPGTVGLNMARADNSGASGSGLVARIRFVAEKAGTGRIEISGAQAVGVGDQSVPMPPAFATVTVSAAPPAPGGGGAKTGG
jgi:general secretion pathway protein D